MAVIEIQPIRLANVKLNIKSGATDVGDFEKHVSTVLMTPTTGSVSWSGLGGNTHSFPTSTTWAVQIDYAQDWKNATSLSRYLYANAGKEVTLTFATDGTAAISTTNPGWRVNITIQPGAVGGAVDTVGTASVTLMASAAPVLVTTP